MTFKPTVLSFICVIALAAAGVAIEFPNPLNLFSGGKPQPTAAAHPAVAAPQMAAAPASFAEIARLARPAVVNVSTTQTVRTQGYPGSAPGPSGEQDPFSEFFRHFYGPMPRTFTQRALGSGAVIDADGYIITNAHVVKNADKIVVKLEDKREVDAKVIGVDEKTDVALLKIQADNLRFITLGDSDSLQVGDWVVAIGNPFGLSETVTAGIVSAKGRVIGEGPYDDFIQTDASINPGNSGGPLLDTHGQVVGINTAIFSRSGGSIGIGFAIPINLAKKVVEQLKSHGKVVRGWIGVAIQDVTPELARSFGLKQAEGALVGDVNPDGPAARAGIERGDVIVECNGVHVDEAHQLPALVAGTEVGKTVQLTVLRNGRSKALSVTVAEMPADVTASAGAPAAGDWGLTVSDITPDLAQQLDLKDRHGVVVTDVAQGSPASEAGMQAGDVIVEVNRQAVRNVADYEKAVASGANAPLLLLVEREGHDFFVALHR